MNDKTIQRVSVLFVVIAALTVLGAMVAVRNINREVAASDWVNHTHAVILELGEIRTALHASDAALRSLALGGGERDEAACQEAVAGLAEHMVVVKAMLRSGPEQVQAAARLEVLAQARERLTREALVARRSDKGEALRALLVADIAAGTAAEVRRLTDKLKDEQMALLAKRDSEATLQAQATRWTVWTGVALNFVLLGVAAWLVRDDLALRRRAAAALQQVNEQLDARVKERTAELAAANERLTAENLERRWGTQALEHQLRYNELIVNSISDLVFVLTKAQNISRINPAVAHVTGWESTQVIGRPLLGFVRLLEAPSHFSPGIVDPVAQALKEGRDLRELPAVVTDRLSRDVPVRFTLFPLRDRDKVVGAVVILRVESRPA